jgi:OHCU decarboxylase
MRLQALNDMPQEAAEREFLRCCGSVRWARAMAGARPFASEEAVAESADKIWSGLDLADWQEAFAAHPRIGEKPGEQPGSGVPAAQVVNRGGQSWSAQEQAGALLAGDAIRERLAAANRAYDARFGHTFIVCATGRSAEEILAILGQRLTNDPEDEVRIAADEQRKITALRIAKLLHEGS